MNPQEEYFKMLDSRREQQKRYEENQAHFDKIRAGIEMATLMLKIHHDCVVAPLMMSALNPNMYLPEKKK